MPGSGDRASARFGVRLSWIESSVMWPANLHAAENPLQPMEISMANTPIEVKKATPAPVPTTDPWRSFRSEMDRLFDRFSSAFHMPSLRRMFDAEPAFRQESTFNFAAPAVDIAEDDKAYKITAELPGLEAKDVELSISGDMLVLRGEKREEKEQKEKNDDMSERAYGSFQRVFTLPDGIDRDKIVADLAKGALMITLPKTVEAQKPAQKIEVKAAA
jgi:HSP20 family protein